MTGRQFRDLEPGDRVAWRGQGPELGTVICNGRTLVVEWDSGQRATLSWMLAELLDFAPTAIDQVMR